MAIDREKERFEGCLLGLALGDAMGAPYEGGPLERLLWRCLGTTRRGEMRWTDDTQMSLDLAASLIALGRVDPDDLARRFAGSYRWHRGYGPGAAKALKRIARGANWREASRSVHAEGSFGNGAAMRAPVVGLFYADRPDALVEAVRASARVTHAHPLGVEGAVLVASATARALTAADPTEIFEASAVRAASTPYRERLAIARTWLAEGAHPEPREVRTKLGNGIAAIDSCVTALYLACRFLGRPFTEMQSFVVAVGGDVDTLGAMAGAVWGAGRGSGDLPSAPLSRLEQQDRLRALAAALWDRRQRRRSPVE